MSYARVKNIIARPMRRHFDPLRRLVSVAVARPGFALSRMPLMGELIAAVAPAQGPPILVVSLPRSGSSWVGRILGSSESALYLREPMTQSYIKVIGKETSPVFEPGKCKNLRSYDRFAARAFNGVPRFSGNKIVQHPSQWTIQDRKGKRVVIKEVNPLAIERWWEAFHPSIIFLVRHPVAVMRSHRALGWMDGGGTASASESRWEQGGAFQAAVQNATMAFLRKVDHRVVRYEDLCADPIGEFARIFEYCGLRFSTSVQQEIERSSSSEVDYAPGRYDTVRDSRHMGRRWKVDVDPKHVESVRRGYLGQQPPFYTEAADW
jgi:hypothetical protein